MKRNIIIVGYFLVVLLVNTSLSNAQEVQVGISFGNSVIHWNKFNVLSSPRDMYYHQDLYIPKVVRGLIYVKTEHGFLLKGALGYGITKSGEKIDYPAKTIKFTDSDGYPHDFVQDRSFKEINTKVTGFSSDIALLYPITLDNAKRFSIYPGIGVGYYNYNYSGEWNSLTEVKSGYTTDRTTSKGNYDKSKLAGFGQYFVLGFEVKATDRTFLVFEFTKLGYSMLKIKDDDDLVLSKDYTQSTEAYRETIGTTEYDYNANGGLNDISITMGVKFRL